MRTDSCLTPRIVVPSCRRRGVRAAQRAPHALHQAPRALQGGAQAQAVQARGDGRGRGRRRPGRRPADAAARVRDGARGAGAPRVLGQADQGPPSHEPFCVSVLCGAHSYRHRQIPGHAFAAARALKSNCRRKRGPKLAQKRFPQACRKALKLGKQQEALQLKVSPFNVALFTSADEHVRRRLPTIFVPGLPHVYHFTPSRGVLTIVPG